MFTIIRNTLRKSRGALIGWGLGLAALAIMMGSIFDMMVASNEMMDVVNAYTVAMPELAAMFKMDEMGTPIGWLDVEYFSFLPLIIGLFATGVGANMLARDEEDGNLDLILAHPVSRTALFWGRFLANTLVIIILLLISWASIRLHVWYYAVLHEPVFALWYASASSQHGQNAIRNSGGCEFLYHLGFGSCRRVGTSC